MAELPGPFALAERVAEVARGLGIETALIGASALAVHNHVRGTADIELATTYDPYRDLRALERALRALELHVELRMPDAEDPLGGVLQVWETEDANGARLDPVDVVNFSNPHLPRRTPAAEAIRQARELEAGAALRYVRLPDLIALKLYAA